MVDKAYTKYIIKSVILELSSLQLSFALQEQTTATSTINFSAHTENSVA